VALRTPYWMSLVIEYTCPLKNPFGDPHDFNLLVVAAAVTRKDFYFLFGKGVRERSVVIFLFAIYVGGGTVKVDVRSACTLM
jgi:hypothetical protein